MGDKEFKLGLQRSKSSSRCSSPSSSSTYVWPTQVHDLNTNDSSVLAPVDASSYNTNMTILCQDSHKPPLHEHDEDHPNLQYIIGLGHSSQPMDWNLQPSLFGRSIEKSDESCSFKSMLQQDHRNSSTSNFQQVEQQWPPRSQKMMMYSSSSSSSSSPADSEVVFLPSLNSSQLLSSSHHLNPHNIDQNIHSTTSMLPAGLLGYEINHQPQQLQSMPFSNRSTINSLINSFPTRCRINSPSSLDHNQQLLQPNSWPIDHKPQNQLHLSNNAPFWNASTVVSPIINNDVRTNILSSLQMQSPLSTVDGIKAKPSSSSETSNKRPRIESPSPVPVKARKEKMGDRITALQQLVSPFGKTDTASVLSEAIEYIKFLHEQVSVLSNAYMKSTSGASIKQQQICEKWNEGEGGNEDLRSRGLCVVPVSSTFPMTHETSVDFWNPTFGGTFR